MEQSGHPAALTLGCLSNRAACSMAAVYGTRLAPPCAALARRAEED